MLSKVITGLALASCLASSMAVAQNATMPSKADVEISVLGIYREPVSTMPTLPYRPDPLQIASLIAACRTHISAFLSDSDNLGHLTDFQNCTHEAVPAEVLIALVTGVLSLVPTPAQIVAILTDALGRNWQTTVERWGNYGFLKCNLGAQTFSNYQYEAWSNGGTDCRAGVGGDWPVGTALLRADFPTVDDAMETRNAVTDQVLMSYSEPHHADNSPAGVWSIWRIFSLNWENVGDMLVETSYTAKITPTWPEAATNPDYDPHAWEWVMLRQPGASSLSPSSYLGVVQSPYIDCAKRDATGSFECRLKTVPVPPGPIVP